MSDRPEREGSIDEDSSTFTVPPAPRSVGVEQAGQFPPGGPPISAEVVTEHRVLPIGSFAPGQILSGRYEIRAFLGKGGIGEVWHAYDLKLGVEVALKSLLAAFQSQKGLEIFRGEVRAARQVISANVCRIFDLIEVEGSELVSMEHIDGVTLLELLKTRGPLDLKEANEIASQFLTGLEAIHRAGLVHRDVKPGNVMITRTGRVVVMDLGIAKHSAEDQLSFAGTPAYMAPEQLRRGPIDVRTDVFSAAIVLAEMISTGTTRESLWAAVRHDPPKLSDSPWAPVLRRALASDPTARYASAQVLSRALEEVTLHVEGSESKKPYPGLAAFAEHDAEFFFGREAEVETMWKKLRRQHLLAITGASGSGKSSFLRAGVLPATPEGGRLIFCHPGDSPFVALAQALAPELSGDPDAGRALVRFGDPDTAVTLFRDWRRRYSDALLVVDQFEELFTLNARDVQSRFADLLARLTLEADVHVLLSIRDDFLLHCHDHPSLAPVFSDLTPLSPPMGAALRRALVQPALACGYRFEDEGLVDEMLREVSAERGALPLLAFAAARLWEERDRSAGVLNREAYERIGGVAGALAKHAEETLERIGSERLAIVREIFRNLVTAEGTRAARDAAELMSIFADRQAAEHVLRALIDARLLTTFDLADRMADESGTAERVEIIHESLLSVWPRLVHWRTQDAEGSQFRDQLRQAARLWENRGRPRDLLWSSESLREFLLWRDRYSGALTALEETFTSAMLEHANRTGRRRRAAIVTAFAVLLAIALGMSMLWQRSEKSRRDAIAQTRRAEASKLFALGRLEIDRNPSGALAYALASLELHDDPAVRLFALSALWRQPPFSIIDVGERFVAEFSPDGQWIAAGGRDGKIRLWSRSGGTPRTIGAHSGAVVFLGFTAASDILVSAGGDDRLLFWSIPQGKELRSLHFDKLRVAAVPAQGRFVVTFSGDEGYVAQAWSLEQTAPIALGKLPIDVRDLAHQPVDVSRDSIAFGNDRAVFIRPLLGPNTRPTLVGQHDDKVTFVSFSPDGKHFASAARSGEIRLWSTESVPPKLMAIYRSPGEMFSLRFSGNGRMVIATFNEKVRVWDLNGPPDAEPMILTGMATTDVNSATTDAESRWLLVASDSGLSICPLTLPRAHILRGHTGRVSQIAFSPDGSWLASAWADGTIRIWQIRGDSRVRSRVLFEDRTDLFNSVAIDPAGRNLAFSSMSGKVWYVPLDNGTPRVLSGFKKEVSSVAFDPTGHMIAGAGGRTGFHEAVIRVWDVVSGETQVLDPEDDNWSTDLKFTADGGLLAASATGVRLWNPLNGTFRMIDSSPVFAIDVSRDGRQLAEVRKEGVVLRDLSNGRTRSLRHGDSALSVALNPSATMVASSDEHGSVRLGPCSGEEPHLLIGHEGSVFWVSFSPDGARLATAGTDQTIRLWPVLHAPPLHTLPYGKLLERLRAATNLRAVRDGSLSSGYRFGNTPFAGWKSTPQW